MRKIFTLVAFLMASYAVNATTYTDNLVISVSGTPSAPKSTNIEVTDKGGGVFEVQLSDFVFGEGDAALPIGNIKLEATATQQGDITYLYAPKSVIDITPGSGDASNWFGPLLGDISGGLLGKIYNNKLYAVINIEAAGQNVEVVFGGGYQIPNSNFETFHDVVKSGWFSSTTNSEPYFWHSMASASGGMASLANNSYISKSTDVRPGSTGQNSVQIKSASVLSIVANGTLTTGRINAGSASAADVANNSYIDLTSTDKDGVGNPFYVNFAGRPDSVSVWVKFKQAKPNEANPNAVINARVISGEKYQLPEDKTYDNIVASGNATFPATKDFGWQRLSIPLQYTDNTAQPTSILITMSTNANPGQGSGGDLLLVDDLELVYNSKVNGLNVKGTPVANFASDTFVYDYSANSAVSADDISVDANSNNVVVLKSIEDNVATIVVASNDLKTSQSYQINLTQTTGIKNANVDFDYSNVEYFDINGVKLSQAPVKGVYIIKDSKGNVRKVVK